MSAELQHLSHSFRTDAGHFLEVATTAYSHSSLRHRDSFQAKIVVNAYMSAECAFKSLICSHDPTQDVSDTFRLILRLGHDLKRLMKHSGQTVLSSDEETFLRKAAKLGVRLRYSVDLFNLSQSELVANDPIAFRLDDQYVEEFLRIADKLSEHAQERHRQMFPDGSPVMKEDDIPKYLEQLRHLQPTPRKKRWCPWIKCK